MMKQQVAKNHLRNKYIGYVVKGAVFVTAPHTKLLNRGGKDFQESVRVHKREIYTSFLACDFARSIGNSSFLCWGVSNVIDEKDLDPNYLLAKHFEFSPFHQGLHHWALKNIDLPLFHIDVHGKMDRKSNCEIDVGIECIRAHWQGDPLIKKIEQFFKNAPNIFEGLTFGKFQCKYNTDPNLHGYWGGAIHTMTEQAIILGIPSIQLQIPMMVRKKLYRDGALRAKFSNLLKQLYEKVIVSDYKEKKRVYKVSEQLGVRFVSCIVTKKEQEEVHAQLLNFQKKQESTPNEKKHI